MTSIASGGDGKVALFAAGPYRATELAEADVAALQRFFEANPEYFLAVGGQPPAAAEARDEFDALPPAGWPYGRRWILGFMAADGTMAGMASVVSDFLAAGVWHVGLFIVATKLHGGGAAHHLYGALESWMRGNGARWTRLGVVEGNARAERFWERAGYLEVRKRHGVAIGRRVNSLRVMAKPLAAGTLDEYLALIARDHPDSP